ncbi:hypothetical protein MCO_01608 [Bartonella sp. DB5-6]|nr:hypothetical protein MCO_01608 [Bartonella sp. DB5-6]
MCLKTTTKQKDFADKKEHISQVRSEAGKKGAQAKNNTKQHVNNFAEANDKQNVFFAEANAKQNQAIKNQNKNIYKKTKTNVLAKKEIGSENLETIDLVQEPTEVHDLESQSEQITTSSDNQPPIHEQENISKKQNRAQANRGCRLPDDFEPDYAFAIAEGLPPERVKVEIAKFRDFWKARAGKDARKIDWQATWRNWVRKAIENLEKGKNYGKASIEQTGQQRGRAYRITQHMSDFKNADSPYKFLFEDDARSTVPLATEQKAITCRSEENYLVG